MGMGLRIIGGGGCCRAQRARGGKEKGGGGGVRERLQNAQYMHAQDTERETGGTMMPNGLD